jgi:paraquat-inducible protein A
MKRSPEIIPEHVEICPYCDTIMKVPELGEGDRFTCDVCGSSITHLAHKPVIKPFVYSLVSIFLFVCVEIMPFMKISMGGNMIEMNIREAATSIINDEYRFLGIFIYCCMQLFPLVCLLIVGFIYGFFLCHKYPPFLRPLARLFFKLKEWSMIEVFLVATLVSMVKLISMVDMSLQGGFFCFCLFIFFYVVVISSVDQWFVWNRLVRLDRFMNFSYLAGQRAYRENLIRCETCEAINSKRSDRCLCCGHRIEQRKKHSQQKCLAFLIAAMVMYIPANTMPIMITEYMGNASESTILDGVIYMWETGSYPVAVIIFVASVFVPVVKIAILLSLWMCIQFNRFRSTKYKTRLYHMTEFIGKWSMVDVFVVAILTALIHMGSLMSIYPGTASLSFCAVVILTMLSANSFDSRYLWENTDSGSLDTGEQK